MTPSSPINWKLWLATPTVLLWEAVALVVGIDPDRLQLSPNDGGYVLGGSSTPAFERSSFPSLEAHARFQEALKFADRATSYDGPIHAIATGKGCAVALRELVEFFLGCDWDGIPAQLVELARAGATEAESAAEAPVPGALAEGRSEGGAVTYARVLHARLEPRTSAFEGGRLHETDLLSLAEAARMASKHAGNEVAPGDFLRAGARGEIRLVARCPRDATLLPTRASDEPMQAVAGAFPDLPLQACVELANSGDSEWRCIEALEPCEGFDGELARFERWRLPDGEPSFAVALADVRVRGRDVRALADAFRPQPETPEAVPEAAESAPTKPRNSPRPRRTWRDVAKPYMLEVLRSGKFASAAEFERELRNRAGSQGSPFDKGTDLHRGTLWVRELGKPLSLKAIQNNWGKLKQEAFA